MFDLNDRRRTRQKLNKHNGQPILSEGVGRKEQEEHEIRDVPQDFLKTPEGEDFIKIKSQYVMFVDVVTSNQVCVSISMTLNKDPTCLCGSLISIDSIYSIP